MEIKPWSAWWMNTIALTESEKHRYLVIAAPEKFIGQTFFTCLPISTKAHNHFYAHKLKAADYNFLKYDSFVWCNLIVSFRGRHFQKECKAGTLLRPEDRQIIKDLSQLYLSSC